MKNIALILIFFINLHQSSCQVDSIKITPVKDNSIFSEGNNLSDGAGLFIYAGRTNMSSAVQIRRGLIRFDVTSLPINAQIKSVKLTLTTLKAAGNNTTPHNFTLHKLVNHWGEGTSSGLGNGSPATPNDATWQNTFYPSLNWANQGGDFVSSASATAVGILNELTEWSSPQMVSDVNAWILNPATNFGWLIKGEENVRGSAKAFASREGLSFYPRILTIYYSIPAVEKVYISEVNPQKQWIEIYNPAQPSFNLTNYYLANQTATVQLNNSLLLNGNLTLDSAKYAVIKWSGISTSNGELALYNGNPADVGTLMKDYIQYGSANQPRSMAAVNAQVWDHVKAFLPTIFSDTSSYSVQENNAYSSGIATIFSSYIVQRQTPSVRNLICPVQLHLNGNTIDSKYSASGVLRFTGHASSTSSISLFSAQFIEIQPVSSMDKGGFFEVKIGGCPSNQ